MDCFWFLLIYFIYLFFWLGTIIFMTLYNKLPHLFLNLVMLDPLRSPLQFCPPLLTPKCGQSLFSFPKLHFPLGLCYINILILNIESKKKVHPENSLISFHYNIIQDHLNIRQSRFSLCMLHQFIKIMEVLDSFLWGPGFSCTLFPRFSLSWIFHRIRKKCFPSFLSHWRIQAHNHSSFSVLIGKGYFCCTDILCLIFHYITTARSYGILFLSLLFCFTKVELQVMFHVGCVEGKLSRASVFNLNK